jgi:uncharacterized protein YecA (UPF0149 family)
MDTRTGEIFTPEQMEAAQKFLNTIPGHTFKDEFENRIKTMEEPPTAAQMSRNPPRIKGHERCPCGSGKLFKNCCKQSEQSN